jgi:hypothetical protein
MLRPDPKSIPRFIRSTHLTAPIRDMTGELFPYHSGREASASTPSSSPGSGKGGPELSSFVLRHPIRRLRGLRFVYRVDSFTQIAELLWQTDFADKLDVA